MQNLNLTNIVVGVLILFVVIRRQLEAKAVRFKPRFFVILIVIGLSSVWDAVNKQHLDLTKREAWLFGIVGLLGAAIFAALRAWSYKYWVNDDQVVMRQGNWLTIVWWIVGIGVHIFADRLWTGSSATLLLYLGITLLIQRGIVWWRGSIKYPTEIGNNITLQREKRK